MKKICLFLIIFLGLNFQAASAQTQTVNLSTYYPAPFGVYDRLRLVPRAAMGLPCQIGTMYVETPDLLRYCVDDGTGTGEWGFPAGVWTQDNIDAANANVYLSDLARSINVGIGTANPSSKLNIYDGGESTTQTNITQSLTNAGINIETDYTPNAFTPGIMWSTANNSPTKPKAGIYLKETGSGSELYFGTSNLYATGITNDAMVIDPSGNVGIGTTNPLSRLDMGDSTGDIRIYDGNGTAHILGDETSGADGIILRTLGNPTAGEPIFVVESSGLSQRLRVEHSGALKTSNFLEVDGTGDSYIGGDTSIGKNTAPNFTLDVAGPIGIDSGGNAGEVMVRWRTDGYYAVYAP